MPLPPAGRAAMRLTLAARVHRATLTGALEELGLHPGQALALFELHRENGLMQSELAERLLVEPANVTQVVRGLETAGLVARERDPEDARVVRTWLTSAGERLRAPLARAWEEAAGEAFTALTAAERATLERLLERIVLAR